MFDITVAARSETGGRDHNEDRVSVCRDGARWFAVLADGAGGHRGGAQASRCVVDEIETALHDASRPFAPDSLTDAVLRAHDQVRLHQASGEGLDRMHSTVVVLWVDTSSDHALWSHVGDSRLYRARRGAVSLLTSDDSVVQRMLDAGLLTARQAEAHPQKNQLIAALGIDDVIEPHTPGEPVGLEEGDAYLLCSDGWWGGLEASAIADALTNASSPDEWLATMQQHIEALGLPRQDNFSAIGVWVGDVSEATRPMAG